MKNSYKVLYILDIVKLKKFLHDVPDKIKQKKFSF